ncbi:hypothetical protein [Gorillibacterium timonense]|uniref:hypothetical protein n=1 Tax=Gorillibacterium timonense TaxID=1689269 RepID=UPI00071C29BE|nr:hypothetical protein [Gorillibacterium timonense]
MRTIADGRKEGGDTAPSQGKLDNVILFPRTVDYYQIELTKLLETERYQEAAELLRFLLKVDSGDPRNHEEWETLLDWITTIMNEADDGAGVISQEDEGDVTEEELLRKETERKKAADEGYVSRLLEALTSASSPDQILLSLGQLTYVQHPDIEPAMVRWLESTRLHPYLLFKALQTLKRRGASGPVSIPYQGETRQLEIEDTPLGIWDFPEAITMILRRVQEQCEISEPALGFFAEETWAEFLAFVYASPLFNRLAELEERSRDAWSAALHGSLRKAMENGAEDRDMLVLYAVTEAQNMEYKQAGQALDAFMRLQSRPLA